MFDLAVEQTHAGRALVIGDRLDTDIEGGTNSELDTLFVLTGVDGIAEVLAAIPARRPTYIARDLRALFDEISGAHVLADGTATCAGWTISPAGAITASGAHTIDGVRAAAAAAWRAADAGQEFDVAAASAQLSG
jgi:hypothetical protein